MFDIKDLAGLSEPVKALIDRSSDFLGWIVRPNQIVRVAKAESKAAMIMAHSDIEIEKLRAEGAIEASVRERASNRFILEETKNQKNIESIVSKALPEVKLDASPDDIDEDWISNFFDKCRLVSNEEMQFLWGRVLAGEANVPGTFSKRTINLLQEIDQKEAVAFQSLCNFALDPHNPVLLIYNELDEIYHTHGIEFPILMEFQASSLITYNSSGTSKLSDSYDYQCCYSDKAYIIHTPEDKPSEFKVGHVTFTRTGQEIAQLCEASPIEGFGDYLLKRWREFGYTVEVYDYKIPLTPNTQDQ